MVFTRYTDEQIADAAYAHAERCERNPALRGAFAAGALVGMVSMLQDELTVYGKIQMQVMMTVLQKGE